MATTRSLRPGTRLGLVAAAAALLAAPFATAASAAADEPAPGDPLITTADTTWRYLDDGSEPQGDDPNVLAWVAPSFDDSAWKQGTGSFGALNGGLGTLSGGYVPDTLVNHYLNGSSAPAVPTYFFRTAFELDATTLDRLVALEGQVVFDDAVRVYLNGHLIYNDRDARATDTTQNQQYAGTSAAAPVIRDFTVQVADLPEGTLVAGDNVLAITLYQDRNTSSDIYLDVTGLVPILGPAPEPEPEGTDQQLQVTIPDLGDGELVWTIDGTNDLVDLGVAEENGDHFAATGTLNPVRVTDTRPGGPAWAIAGQVSDFVADGETIEGRYLGWTPSLIENTGGAVAGDPVVSGFVSGDGLSVPAVLGSAPDDHPLGTALLGADLDLRIPLTVGQGDYAATLTLTALS